MARKAAPKKAGSAKPPPDSTAPARKVLIVDDDPAIRELLSEYLTADDVAIVEAETGSQALRALRLEEPNIILLDMWLPDMDGLDVLSQVRASEIPVVVITADSSSSRTIRAMQAGAYDYLVKPLEPEAVQKVVDKALARRRPSEDVRELQEALQAQSAGGRERIVGTSGAMQTVYKLVGRVAASNAAILITGETGTGKELVAETIHQNSPRTEGPLVRVNCAALPETLLESELFGHEKGAFTGAVGRRKGRFEMADGGTIFLDEVGELSASTQKKLLRVLQFGAFDRVGGTEPVSVDVRVLAATNRDLEAEVTSGAFREDLYYRLNVIRVELPPLRDRREDIPALVAHFLDRYRPAPGEPPTKISREALDALMAADFPGNVRQLENAIQRAVVFSGGRMIGPEHLDLAHGAPPSRGLGLGTGDGAGPAGADVAGLVRDAVPLKSVLADVERAMITEALRQAEGNRSEAARSLHIYRRLLYQKMEEYGLG